MKEFKKFAGALAEESSKIIKPYFRTNYNIEIKSDLSPVTIADKKAEEKMREMIMKEFPEHGILGEEFGSHNSGSKYQWVLDPIDGTKSFIAGTPLFGTLIGLLENSNPVLGVINLPVLDEFLFGDGRICELNGKPVRVKETDKLSEALLLTTDLMDIEKYQDIEKFNKIIHSVKLFRGWGDCYGYFLVASGYADIMIDPIMNIWDSAAIIPVIKGAGGIITDYYGNDPITGDSIIAASKLLHREIIAILNT